MIMDFIANSYPLLMFITLLAFFILGYQISFSLMAVALIFGLIAHLNGDMHLNNFAALPENIWGSVMINDTLLAIPFFTLMGLILERCGIAEDLLDNIAKLFGPVSGGLAYAVIFVGAILAATTGIVAASVIAMGLISLPIMLRYHYDRKVACGTIIASGTLAQILPPSLVLIILSDQLGQSVGDMYKGALLPSLLLIAFYCFYIFGTGKICPKKLPAANYIFSQDVSHKKIILEASPIFISIFLSLLLFFPAGTMIDTQKIAPSHFYSLIIISIIGLLSLPLLRNRNTPLFLIIKNIIQSIIPPLFLIFLVLGTIFQGICTPTEAGAMGACGAILLSFFRKKLSHTLLKEATIKTTELATFVMFILIGARIFTFTFYNLDGHHFIEGLFGNLPGGVLGFLLIVNIMIFFLAFFLDFFEIVFILVPLLAPIAQALGIDLIWFGVILGLNLQTSFMTPPFGFSLFYMRSVAPKEKYFDEKIRGYIEGIKTTEIYKSVMPFLVIQLIVVLLVIIFPEMVIFENQDNIDLTVIESQLPKLPPLKDPILFLN